MQYKGIEYQVVQTANPTGWRTVHFDATRTKSGTSHSMKSAVLEAQRKIDKELVSVKVK